MRPLSKDGDPESEDLGYVFTFLWTQFLHLYDDEQVGLDHLQYSGCPVLAHREEPGGQALHFAGAAVEAVASDGNGRVERPSGTHGWSELLLHF